MDIQHPRDKRGRTQTHSFINSNRPHPVHFCLDSLIVPDLVINWTVIGVVRGPQIWQDECRSLALKEVDRLARAEQLRTRKRPDVWQAATVMTAAYHDNMLH